jgi:hypothetical protein
MVAASIVDTFQLAGAIVLWASAVMGALGLIAQRSGSFRAHIRQRVARNVREFVSPIIREELLATNGGSTVYDRLSKVELVTGDMAQTVEGLPAEFNKITADLAMMAESGRERAAMAEHRAERIEGQIERLDGRIDAVFQHPPHP